MRVALVPPITVVLRFGATVVQTTATPVQQDALRVTHHLSLAGSQLAELRRLAAADGDAGRAIARASVRKRRTNWTSVVIPAVIDLSATGMPSAVSSAR